MQPRVSHPRCGPLKAADLPPNSGRSSDRLNDLEPRSEAHARARAGPSGCGDEDGNGYKSA